MKVLDCESIDSTYDSLGRLFDVQRETLELTLDKIDLGGYPGYPVPTEKYLFDLVGQKLSPKNPIFFDRICWFHLTRTLEMNAFEDGILPLGEQINSIWEFLYTLLDGKLSRAEWDDFRANEMALSENHYAYLYRMKTGDPAYWGPYALLIKDTAFKPNELHNHDYFRVPEIVEDVCIVLQELHGMDLLPVFLEKTKPCIVKFVDDDVKSYCLEAALYHLYHLRKGDGCAPLSNCSISFDGKGKTIPKERIFKREFPNYAYEV